MTAHSLAASLLIFVSSLAPSGGKADVVNAVAALHYTQRTKRSAHDGLRRLLEQQGSSGTADRACYITDDL